MSVSQSLGPKVALRADRADVLSNSGASHSFALAGDTAGAGGASGSSQKLAIQTLQRDQLELKAEADKLTRELAHLNHVMAEHKLGGSGVPVGSGADGKNNNNLEHDADSEVQDHGTDILPELPPWVQNATVMAPLVHSYEDRIRELEYEVRRTYGLAEHSQNLAYENDELRDKLADVIEQIQSLNSSIAGGAGGDAQGGGGRGSSSKQSMTVEEEKEEFEQLYKLSIEQNGVLAQQNVLLKSQVDKMHTAVQQATQRSQNDSRQVIDAARTCQQLEASIAENVKQREEIEVKVQIVSKDLAAQQQQNRGSNAKLDEKTKDLKENKRQEETMKTNYREKKHRLEQENRKKANESEKFEKEITEKTGRLRKLETANVTLSEKHHKLNRESKLTQSELEKMLTQVEALEEKEKRTRNECLEVVGRLDRAENDLAELQIEKSKLETMQALHLNACAGTSSGATIGMLAAQAQAEAGGNLSSGGGNDRDTESNNIPSAAISADVNPDFNLLTTDAVEKVSNAIIKATQGEIDRRQKQCEELEEKLFKLSETYVELQSKYEGLEKRAEFEKESLQARVELLTQETTEQGADLEEIQTSREQLEKDLELAKSTLLNTRKRIEDLHSKTVGEISKRAQQSSFLSQSMEQTRQRLRGTATEKDVLQVQREKLVVRLENLQRENMELSAKQEEIRAAEKSRIDEERRTLVRKMKTLQHTAKDREKQAIELLTKQENVRSQWREKLTVENAELKRQVEMLKNTLMSNKMGVTLQSALTVQSLEQSRGEY